MSTDQQKQTTGEAFYHLLAENGEGLIWAASQVPAGHHFLTPPGPPEKLGEWSAGRHLFHVVCYEKQVVEIMRQWFDGQHRDIDPLDEDALWKSGCDWDTMLADFQNSRQSQLDLISVYEEGDWHKVKDTSAWGEHDLRWLVTKTYQHSCEHINYLLQLVLRWDSIAERFPDLPAGRDI